MMRHEVFEPSVQLKDLHPDAIYQHEMSLAREFVRGLPCSAWLSLCPFCGAERHEVLFEKWGQRYALCARCWSLSLGTLPSDEVLNAYSHDSDLARYRATSDYQIAFTRMRQELWSTQLEWAEGRIYRYLKREAYRVVDWGTRILGWVETMRKAPSISEYVLANPLPPVEPSGEPESCDVALLLDVVQRFTRPVELLTQVYHSLKPGGILLLTSRSGSGFDVLTLAGESESIFPLDHICLPSPNGLSLVLEQAGFDILELTTPGLLDVQLVRQAGERVPVHNYFQRYMLSQFGEEMHERLQAFLQQNNLSSHLRAVARKPEILHQNRKSL